MRLFKLDDFETESYYVDIDRPTVEFIYRISPTTVNKLKSVCIDTGKGKIEKVVLPLPKYKGFSVAERIAMDKAIDAESRRQGAALYRLAAMVQKESGLSASRIREALANPFDNLDVFGERASELANLRNSTVENDRDRVTIILNSRITALLSQENRAKYEEEYPEKWTTEDTSALPVSFVEKIIYYCNKESIAWEVEEIEPGEILPALPSQSSNTQNQTGTQSTSISNIGDAIEIDSDVITLQVA